MVASVPDLLRIYYYIIIVVFVVVKLLESYPHSIESEFLGMGPHFAFLMVTKMILRGLAWHLCI